MHHTEQERTSIRRKPLVVRSPATAYKAADLRHRGDGRTAQVPAAGLSVKGACHAPCHLRKLWTRGSTGGRMCLGESLYMEFKG